MLMKTIDVVTRRRANLRAWIDDNYDGAQARFVDDTGINQGELSGLLRSKSFGEKKARALEIEARMPPDWLDEDHSVLELNQDVPSVAFSRRNSESKRADDNAFNLPQYREVIGSMGRGVILKDQPGQITSLRVTNEWLAKNVPAHTGKNNLGVVTGFGDSMKGMYNSGDPLLVDGGVKSCDYDGVYFFRVGEEGFIKRLQRIPGQGILVISQNPEYRDWTITPDMDFEVFAKVLKVWESTDF